MLDPMYILSLSPKILVMVGDKVWHNPLVKTMFRVSRFINANNTLEELEQQVANAISDGYSVAIFPEGVRSDGEINRFRNGAFHLSKKLGVDIVPLYIHGSGHVMPKGSGFSSSGQVDLMIGERIAAERLDNLGETVIKMTKRIQELYTNRYEQFRGQIENTHYFHDYVIAKHIYKGSGIEKETQQLLRRYDDFSKWIDDYQLEDTTSNTVSVIHAGRGQFSLLMALVHPEWEVLSYTDDPDDAALAASCEPKPANLHVYCASDAQYDTKSSNMIDFSTIMNGAN